MDDTADPSVDADAYTDLMRRPLLTLTEAREVVEVLQLAADAGGAEAVRAGELARMLAYRLPAD